jgi:hypothetical protein
MHGIVFPYGMKGRCLSFEEKDVLALGQGLPPRGRSLAYPRYLRVEGKVSVSKETKLHQ